MKMTLQGNYIHAILHLFDKVTIRSDDSQKLMLTFCLTTSKINKKLPIFADIFGNLCLCSFPFWLNWQLVENYFELVLNLLVGKIRSRGAILKDAMVSKTWQIPGDTGLNSQNITKNLWP